MDAHGLLYLGLMEIFSVWSSICTVVLFQLSQRRDHDVCLVLILYPEIADHLRTKEDCSVIEFAFEGNIFRLIFIDMPFNLSQCRCDHNSMNSLDPHHTPYQLESDAAARRIIL